LGVLIFAKKAEDESHGEFHGAEEEEEEEARKEAWPLELLIWITMPDAVKD